jgi:peroxiredoxin
MAGARLIEDEVKVKAFKAEVIERFPRGLAAQKVRLDAARDAENPHIARSLYIAYIDEFPENTSWVQLAARDCFEVVANHPDRFTLDEMIEAAEAFDRSSVEYIPVYGNPTIRLHALVTISTAFLDHDPEQSLLYADRGLEFVAETVPQTDEFDETIGRNFNAVKVMAYARLERWTEARELAAEVIAQRGDQELDLVRWLSFEEPQFRATYADALVAGGDVDAAHRQFRYAVALEPALQERYDNLCATYPLDGHEAESMDIAVTRFMKARTEDRKRRLLSQAQDRPAPHFTARNLKGNEVSIEDFRGKVLVLDIWATWCGPCMRELKELKKAWAKYQDVPDIEFVAVSIDSDRTKVPPFVEKNDYRFPVLLSDGRFQEDYVGGEGIPQLYIIDRDGNIRFHKRGFAPGHFIEHLDWMIEAAMIPLPLGE